MKTNCPPFRAPFRQGIKTVLVVLLLVAGTAGLYHGVKYLRRDSVPPVPTSVQSPMGPAGRREWSKEVVHYPGFSIGKKGREWSHFEIAERHKALLLKELPSYVTELRGCGAEHETDGTSAAWLFVVPREHMSEFANYLTSLGIPLDALHEEKDVLVPKEYRDSENRPPPPRIPATDLIFSRALKSEGEAQLMGVKFGKSSDTMTYSLVNPNNIMVAPRIRVSWRTGNVQVYELPYEPDWEK